MYTFSFKTVQGQTDVFYSEEIILPEVDKKNAIYITDKNTVEIAKKAKNFNYEIPLIVIENGEEYKCYKSVELILQKALESGLTRQAVFVAIGGGMICDLTAFSASIYMRGVSCKFVATSLLSMVDASIGGKTAINFNNYKNILGSFYKADEIYICIQALDTLNDEQYLSGLAEALKTALLYSPKMYSLFIKNKNSILKRDKTLILEIIKNSVEAKANIVSRDFNEKSERVFLNLGHTFAHALETVSKFSILHGSAVAWGICRVLELGKNLRITNIEYANEVSQLIKSYGYFSEASPFHSKKFYNALNLKMNEEEFIYKIIATMQKDKKNINSEIRLVMQENIGKTFLKAIKEKDIRSVLK